MFKLKPRLISCRACAAEVSESAYSCPRCAHPLRKSTGKQVAEIFAGVVMALVALTVASILWVFAGVVQ